MPGNKISPKSLELLKRGIELAKADQKPRARRFFREAVYEEPRNEMAWLWLASVADTPQEAMANIDQALAINPGNRAAEEWLQRLQVKAQNARPKAPPQAIGYLDLDRLREALSYLRAASELQPENQRLVEMVGRLERRLPGASPAAEVPLERSIEAGESGLLQTDLELSRQDTPDTSSEASKARKAHRGTVLVAEDDPDTRGVVMETLAPLGYHLLEANSGLEALALLQQTIPDLILLSTSLSQPDGYQVLRLIKSTDLTRSIPVVLLKRSTDLWGILRSRFSSVDSTLTKPLRPSQLEQTVIHFFGKS